MFEAGCWLAVLRSTAGFVVGSPIVSTGDQACVKNTEREATAARPSEHFPHHWETARNVFPRKAHPTSLTRQPLHLHRRLVESDRKNQEALRALARKRILEARYDDHEDRALPSRGAEIPGGRRVLLFPFTIYQARINLWYGVKHPNPYRHAEVVQTSDTIRL